MPVRDDGRPGRLRGAVVTRAVCFGAVAALLALGAGPVQAATWFRLALGGSHLDSVLIDPTTPTTMYLGSTLNEGVLKSTDGGLNWTQINNGLDWSGRVHEVLFEPGSTTTLYAAVAGGFLSGYGVHKSTDAGASWTQFGAAAGITHSELSALAIDPLTPTTLYAGTDGGGVFKSTNAGVSWTPVNTGLTSTAVSAVAAGPGVVYAGTDDGLFRTTNGGLSWTATSLTTSDVVWTLAVDAAGVAYAGFDSVSGPYRSTSGGASWTSINSGVGSGLASTIAIDPTDPDTLYFGHFDVFKSTNAGAGWTLAGVTDDTLASIFTDLAVDPAATHIVYATTRESGVFVLLPSCGDGIVDVGETCDDGNTDGGDCCAGDCSAITGGLGTPCGADTECEDPGACDGNGMCVQSFAPQGAACTGDGDPCTLDVCDGAGGCAHAANRDPCDDGDVCTVADHCSNGSCAGMPNRCDDNDICTDDTCEAGTGCTHVPAPDVEDLCTEGGAAEVTCRIRKLRTAGGYDACRLDADSRAVRRGESADFSECTAEFETRWAEIEENAAGACLTTGDTLTIESVVSGHEADTLAALTPAGIPPTAEGKRCASAKLEAAGRYDFCRLRAEARAVKAGKAPDYGRCEARLSGRFARAEGTAGCPTSGDAAVTASTGAAHTDNVVLLLNGVATSCPVAVALTTRPGYGASVDNPTRIATGTPGVTHVQDLPAGDTAILEVSGCAGGATPPCGNCAIAGVHSSYLGRCANDPTTLCDEIDAPDADDCGGDKCFYYWWGPPRHIYVGSASACLVQHLRADVTGSFNAETGAAELDVKKSLRYYLGLAVTRPCPVCLGDATANDGARDGTCDGGPRDGLGCDANGDDATFGPTSYDCQPEPGSNLSASGIRTDVVLTTDGDFHAFGVPCSVPFDHLTCPCAVCSGASTVACSADAECSILGAGTCNSTGGGNSLAPNECTDSVCSALASGMGECGEPVDSFCDGETRASGEGYLECSSNIDCSTASLGFNAGSCTLSANRSCLPDPIVAPGAANPNRPVLAGIACLSPTANAAVNSVFGLPGPERTRVEYALSRIY